MSREVRSSCKSRSESQIEPERLVHLLSQPALGLRVAPDHKIYTPAPALAAGPVPLFEATRELLRQLGG